LIDRLEWLHVSDLHFVAHGDEFSQRVATQSLLDDVPTRVADERPVGFVLVTGDVAFSGSRDEYERASEFLSGLASAVRVPPERFFFVPGNHDVDRKRQRLAYGGACDEVTSQPAVDRLLGSPDDLRPLIDRQEAFRSFVETFTGNQERAETPDGLAYAASLVFGGLRVSIIGLNSAWLSGKDAEEMKLVIGERQVIDALELARSSNPQVQIAMAHHPIGWLQEWDQVSCSHRLLPEVHFYHRGHLHITEVSLSSSPERPCLSIAAGSGHATRFYGNSYNLVELDLGAGICTVRPFRFDAAASRYAPSATFKASVVLQGALSGTTDDLARALATEVLHSEPYARYLAELLNGEKSEIPVRVGDAVEFRTTTVAEAIAAEDLTAATEFLRLRNLLRLYDDNIPLSERVGDHVDVIEGFVRYLSPLAKRDKGCADRLAGTRRITTNGAESRLPHTADFLADLRGRGDWILLETQAARFLDSPDRSLARLARTALAEALMHSDEAEKRKEAMRLATESATSADASAADYLLAAACCEVAGEDAAAVNLANRALTKYSDEPDVRTYAQGLALRTGDAALRAEVDRATGDRGRHEC
jgi:predicted MPP superfamily phosphohydrolase